MTTSASLRKTLRKMPSFRSLSGHELDAIIAQMLCKEYKSGDILWHTGVRLDFLGIIQNGEIVIERRIKGVRIRSIRLVAGDIVQSPDSGNKNNHSVFLASAVTDVRLWVLQKKHLTNLFPHHSNLEHPPLHHKQRTVLNLLWDIFIVFLIIYLSWHDLSRVLSGSLYLISEQEKQSTYYDEGKAMQMLNYAEALDPSAVFAHNQEGYLWFQNNNLNRAQNAFIQATQIDRTNGPALNNLAVTYYLTGETQQSIAFQENAVRNDLDNAIVRYNLGLILTKQNIPTQAVLELKQASYINPKWVLPYLEQGFNYLQMQDYTNAEKSARSAIKLDSTQAVAHFTLGIALFNQGKNYEALNSIESTLWINPDNRVAQFYKALILINQKKHDAALKILQHLLDTSNDPQQTTRIKAEIEHIHRILQNPAPKLTKGGE